jgi:DNA anti-recombination protein RmuC
VIPAADLNYCIYQVYCALINAMERGLGAESTVWQSLAQLEADFGKCMEEFEKTGLHLTNAQSAYGRAMRKFEKLHDRLSALEDVRKGQIQEVKASLTEDA